MGHVSGGSQRHRLNRAPGQGEQLIVLNLCSTVLAVQLEEVLVEHGAQVAVGAVVEHAAPLRFVWVAGAFPVPSVQGLEQRDALWSIEE